MLYDIQMNIIMCIHIYYVIGMYIHFHLYNIFLHNFYRFLFQADFNNMSFTNLLVDTITDLLLDYLLIIHQIC